MTIVRVFGLFIIILSFLALYIVIRNLFKHFFGNKTPKESRIEKANVRRAIINIIDDEDKKYILYVPGTAFEDYGEIFIMKAEPNFNFWLEK
jgi:hypothetical protein